MPITGEQSFAQFAGTINQQHATAAQFAVAIGRLKQAEEQFNTRQKYAEETFKFEQRRWQAEKGLLDQKLHRLELENGILQKDAKLQEMVPGAMTKLAQGMGKVATAVTSGDPTKIAEAHEGMGKILADPEVSKVAHIAIPQARNYGALFGIDPQLVGQMLGGKGRAQVDVLGGTEYLKFEKELYDQSMRNMTGHTDEELRQRHADETTQQQKQARDTVTRINSIIGKISVSPDSILQGAAFTQALQRIIQGDTSGLVGAASGLQQARGEANTPEEVAALDEAIETLRTHEQRGDMLNLRQSVDLQKQAAARVFSQDIVSTARPPQGGLTEPGAGVIAPAALKRAETKRNTLTRIYNELAQSKPYHEFMQSADKTKVEQSLTLLMGAVSGEPKETQELFKRGLAAAKQEHGVPFKLEVSQPAPVQPAGPRSPDSSSITMQEPR